MITLDNTGTYAFSGTSGSSSFTVGAGANLLVAWAAWNPVDGLTNACTYNGVALSAGNTFNQSCGNLAYFYLVNPPSGSNTLTMATFGTISATPRRVIGIYSFFGAHVGSPFGAEAAGGFVGGGALNSSAGGANETVTALYGNSVIMDVLLRDAAGGSVGALDIGTVQFSNNSLSTFLDGATTQVTNPGAYTGDWTWTTGANFTRGMVEVRSAEAQQIMQY